MATTYHTLNHLVDEFTLINTALKELQFVLTELDRLQSDAHISEMLYLLTQRLDEATGSLVQFKLA